MTQSQLRAARVLTDTATSWAGRGGQRFPFPACQFQTFSLFRGGLNPFLFAISAYLELLLWGFVSWQLHLRQGLALPPAASESSHQGMGTPQRLPQSCTEPQTQPGATSACGTQSRGVPGNGWVFLPTLEMSLVVRDELKQGPGLVFTTSGGKSSPPLWGEPVPLAGAELSPALVRGTELLCLCMKRAARSTWAL